MNTHSETFTPIVCSVIGAQNHDSHSIMSDCSRYKFSEKDPLMNFNAHFIVH